MPQTATPTMPSPPVTAVTQPAKRLLLVRRTPTDDPDEVAPLAVEVTGVWRADTGSPIEWATGFASKNGNGEWVAWIWTRLNGDLIGVPLHVEVTVTPSEGQTFYEYAIYNESLGGYLVIGGGVANALGLLGVDLNGAVRSASPVVLVEPGVA